MTPYSRPVKIHISHIQNILITAIPLQPLYIKSYSIIRNSTFYWRRLLRQKKSQKNIAYLRHCPERRCFNFFSNLLIQSWTGYRGNSGVNFMKTIQPKWKYLVSFNYGRIVYDARLSKWLFKLRDYNSIYNL